MTKSVVIALVLGAAVLLSAGSPRVTGRRSLNSADEGKVAAYAELVSALGRDLSEADHATFEKRRDLIQLLGYLRPADSNVVGTLSVALIADLDRSTPESGPARHVQALVLYESVTPAPAALARAGAPAIPSLIARATAVTVPAAERETAERALRMMLGRGAAYWYEKASTPGATGNRDYVSALLARARTVGLLRPPSANTLWRPIVSYLYSSAPEPRGCSDIAQGMSSAEASIRDRAKRVAYDRRQQEIHELAVRLKKSDRSREDRTDAATTLGLIRGVSQESAQGLVAMLDTESVRPNEPLSEEQTPAALALVRIDIPVVPVLTDTIRTSDNQLLRSNCAGVMAIMLGQYAKPWLQDVEASAKTPVEKQRVAQVLRFWAKYCTGEGYYANGGSHGLN